MITKKSEKILEEKRPVEIESSIVIKQDGKYKGTFNPIYGQMMDEGIV